METSNAMSSVPWNILDKKIVSKEWYGYINCGWVKRGIVLINNAIFSKVQVDGKAEYLSMYVRLPGNYWQQAPTVIYVSIKIFVVSDEWRQNIWNCLLSISSAE